MSGSSSVSFEVKFQDITLPKGKDVGKMLAKLQGEHMLHKWLHLAMHRFRGQMAKVMLGAVIRLVPLVTVYTIGDFLWGWLDRDIKKKARILRSHAGNTATPITEVIGQACFDGNHPYVVAVGWAEYFAGETSTVWIAGMFACDADGKPLTGEDLLPAGSNYRKYSVPDEKICAYSLMGKLTHH